MVKSKESQNMNIEITDLNEIFNNMDPTDLLIKDAKIESDYYYPIPKFAKNGKNYISKIKFIPYIQNPKMSIISKWVVYLRHPNGTKRYVDCPSTINQPSILQDLFFALRNSENNTDRYLSQNFARRRVFFSLVQILADENRPDLVGKIKIFKYGQKLYNKLDKMMNPKPETKAKPQNPFDIFNGRPFELDISIKAGFNDYDDCEFAINPEPFKINGEIIENSPNNYKRIAEWILENSPNLLQNQFKPWDEETLSFVLDTINEIVPNTKLVEQILKKSNINIDFLTHKKVTKQSNLKTNNNNSLFDDETEVFTKKRADVFNEMKIKISKEQINKENENLIDDFNEFDETNEIDEIDEIEEIMKTPKKKTSEFVPNKQKTKTIIDDEDDLYAGL